MLGVTDFLVKGRLDAVSARALDPLRGHATTRCSASCARARTATRSPSGARTTGSGTGTWRGHDLLRRRAGRRCSATPRTRSATRPTSGSIACTPRTLARLRAAIDAHSTGRTPHFESEHRIRHADGTLPLGASAAGSPCATATARATRVAGLDDRHHRPQGRRGAAAPRRAATTRSPGCPTGRCSSTTSSSRCSRAQARPATIAARSSSSTSTASSSSTTRFSHAVGDQLLVALAQRLRAAMRAGDTVARLGGDEFTVLLDDIGPGRGRVEVAERIQATLGTPFSTDGPGPDRHGEHRDRAQRARQRCRGDDAQRRHRDVRGEGRQRRGIARVRPPACAAGVVGQLQLETELREAIERRALRVFYQPIVELETGRLAGFEALARWPPTPTREVLARSSSSRSPRRPA